MNQERFIIEHRADESRYALLDRGEDAASTADLKEIGEESYLDVDALSDVEGARSQRIFYHTGVSPDYGGQGLASKLVRFAIDDAIASGHDIVPVCPYVAGWIEKHPEYADHAVEPTQKHSIAVRRSLA